VHGGAQFSHAVRLDANVIAALDVLIPLAPLHQPHNLAGVRALAAVAPGVPQVACFDTAFHQTQAPLARAYALPRAQTEAGIKRYGFHGLSFEYIAGVLPDYMAEQANGRVIVAHLGNGASLCALKDRRSVATTMGFTPLDGLVMGTRCGALDPGVVLYLLTKHGMGIDEVTDLLYNKSGLLGVSGLTHDVRRLLESEHADAQNALDLFVYRVGRELGSLAAALGGLDALVFTGGIGENAAVIRGRICNDARWLGVTLDDPANDRADARISATDSTVSVWVIPTREDFMIARQTLQVIRSTNAVL
jgi:acetate kinase